MPPDGEKQPGEILKDKLVQSSVPGTPRRRRTPYLLRPISASGIPGAFLVFSYVQQYILRGRVETIPYSQI